MRKILAELSEYQYECIIISYLDKPEVFEDIRRLWRRMPVALISADSSKTDFDIVYLNVREATYRLRNFLLTMALDGVYRKYMGIKNDRAFCQFTHISYR